MTSSLRITEIFKSIQGESTRAGLPCAFVRLTGCALRCVWCDSAYAFHGGAEMTVDEAAARVLALDTNLVEVLEAAPRAGRRLSPDGRLRKRADGLLEPRPRRWTASTPSRQIVAQGSGKRHEHANLPRTSSACRPRPLKVVGDRGFRWRPFVREPAWTPPRRHVLAAWRRCRPRPGSLGRDCAGRFVSAFAPKVCGEMPGR